MKLQKVKTANGYRYTILDNEYKEIEPVKRYLLFLDKTKRSRNTIKTYAYHLKTYCEFLYEKQIDILDIDSLENIGPLEFMAEYLEWVEGYKDDNIIKLDTSHSGITRKTINTKISVVLLFYEFMARNNMTKSIDAYKNQSKNNNFKNFLYELVHDKNTVRTNLFHQIEKDEELKYIDENDYRQILKLCKTSRDKALISVMFDGGLRVGEALGLRISDIHIWDNKISVVFRENNENETSVKYRSEGNVYVSSETMGYITDYISNEIDNTNSDYLFINLKKNNKGNAMKVDTVEKLFNRFSKALGKKVTPHMCRHGSASERIMSGWDEPSVQKHLRHKDVSSTRRYEHLKDKYLIEKNKGYCQQKNNLLKEHFNDNESSNKNM